MNVTEAQFVAETWAGDRKGVDKIRLKHPPNVVVVIDVVIVVAINGQLSFYLSFSLNILSC